MTPKRQRLIDAGLCVNYDRCGGERVTSTECRDCANARSRTQSRTNAEAREARRAGKLCSEPRCTSRRAVGRNGRRLRVCAQHAIEQQERSKNYRARRRRLRAD